MCLVGSDREPMNDAAVCPAASSLLLSSSLHEEEEEDEDEDDEDGDEDDQDIRMRMEMIRTVRMVIETRLKREREMIRMAIMMVMARRMMMVRRKKKKRK